MLRFLMTSVMIVALAAGCSREKPVPIVYEKNGVKFSHLSNWKVTGDDWIGDSKNGRIVNVEGPASSLLMMVYFPETSDVTLESFADEVAEGRMAEIKDKFRVGSFKLGKVVKGSSEGCEQMIGGNSYTGIRQQFSITLLGQLVPHQATFFMLQSEKCKLIVVSQVSDNSRKAAEPGFRTIYDSITLSGLQNVLEQPVGR